MRSGRCAITGGRDLKGTQAYPQMYGEEVFRCWHLNRLSMPEEHYDIDDMSDISSEFDEDLWEDADMKDLVKDMGVCFDHMPFKK